MSWDTIADQWIWFSAAGVFVILVGVLVVYNLYKSKPNNAIQEQKDPGLRQDELILQILDQMAILSFR